MLPYTPDWQAHALRLRAELRYLAGLLRHAGHADWAQLAEQAAQACPEPGPQPVGPWGAGVEVK